MCVCCASPTHVVDARIIGKRAVIPHDAHARVSCAAQAKSSLPRARGDSFCVLYQRHEGGFAFACLHKAANAVVAVVRRWHARGSYSSIVLARGKEYGRRYVRRATTMTRFVVTLYSLQRCAGKNVTAPLEAWTREGGLEMIGRCQRGGGA